MKLRFTIGALALAALATACAGAKPARSQTITSTAQPASALNHAARILAQQGMSVARIDEQAGIIQSAWQATRFGYGMTSASAGVPRYITRRATITVMPKGNGSEVFVRVEDMACANPDAFIAGDATVADCRAVAGIVPPDQKLLDRIGSALARALGVAPSRTAVRRSATAQ